MDNITAPTQGTEFLERISTIEKDNQQLRGLVADLQNLCINLQKRIDALEKSPSSSKSVPAPAKPAPAPAKKNDDDDDGVDLFGSDDDEDEEAAKIREERLAAYAAKKSKSE
jgi:elongation factor 1-delta